MKLFAIFNNIMLVLVIIGAFELGGIGFFGIDLIANLFGDATTTASRIFFALIGLAGIWCITIPFQLKKINNSEPDSAK